MELELFNRQMSERGWVKFPAVVPDDLVVRMLDDLQHAYKHCRKIQIENDVDNSEGTCHHLIGQGNSFLEYLDLFEDLNEYAESYFGGKYILNAFGGNILTKDSSYANTIHRDMRSFSGTLPLMLNTIVMLDDFTLDNGATWLMNQGHIHADKPSPEDFSKSAFPITGNAGDVVFFNSNMWHRAGANTTDRPRRSVTPMFTRPFYKQQFNYARFVEPDYSEWIKQVLGAYSRTPAILSDWYRSPEKRFYRGDQG